MTRPNDSQPSPDPSAEQRMQAIDTYFEGDHALFDDYLSTCVIQFTQDRLTGDRAGADSDWPVLRRVAHNLKTVLQTVGYPDAGGMARDCETASQDGNADLARQTWAQVSGALQTILTANVQRTHR